MNTSALILAVAIATSTFVVGKDCTVDDLTAISNVYSTASDESCPDMTKMTGGTDYCTYADCLTFMTDMVEKLPDCSTGGINVKESVRAALTVCETGTADVSKVFANSSSTATSGSNDAATLPSAGSFSSDKASGDSTASDASSLSLSSFSFAVSSASFAVVLFAGL
uniref:Elicitin n=1 Tax=Peronospora matthiolae TaxID=2874970 RepID=A0AAV1U5X7_9STRA